MPLEHQKYLEWNGDRFRRWADSIGINTSKGVDAILTSGRVEQQSYRSCMGLLKLAEKHLPAKLEQACARALSYSGKPSYKTRTLCLTRQTHIKQQRNRTASQEELNTMEINDHDKSKSN